MSPLRPCRPLGHASAIETLDTYSHLWPDSDERTRDAVDLVLRPTADYLRTAATNEGENRRSGGYVDESTDTPGIAKRPSRHRLIMLAGL